MALLPVAKAVPPHAPLYHFQLAPVPKVPPLTVNVVDAPKHISVDPVIDAADNEESLTVTVTDLQTVLLQIPSALTKYVVVDAGETVSEVPVLSNVPPQLLPYHFQLAPVPKLPPDIDNVVLWPTQIVVVPVMLLAGMDVSRRVTVKLLQMVLLHLPSARTK